MLDFPFCDISPLHSVGVFAAYFQENSKNAAIFRSGGVTTACCNAGKIKT